MDEIRLKGVRALRADTLNVLEIATNVLLQKLNEYVSIIFLHGNIAVLVPEMLLFIQQVFTEANLEFQEKILERSGLGDETGLSDGIAAMKDGEVKTSLRSVLDESEMVLYDVVEQLLTKTNTDPQEVLGVSGLLFHCFVLGVHTILKPWTQVSFMNETQSLAENLEVDCAYISNSLLTLSLI
jgi:hypothetical protein